MNDSNKENAPFSFEGVASQAFSLFEPNEYILRSILSIGPNAREMIKQLVFDAYDVRDTVVFEWLRGDPFPSPGTRKGKGGSYKSISGPPEGDRKYLELGAPFSLPWNKGRGKLQKYIIFIIYLYHSRPHCIYDEEVKGQC